MLFFKKACGKVNWILKVFPLEKGEQKHKIDSVIQIWKKSFDLIKISKSDKLSIHYLNQGKFPINYKDCSITKIIEWININFPNIDTNYEIVVKKFIPIGSGLGGESTDAAFVLRYFLSKHKIELEENQLKDIALNIGSDILFFYSKFGIAHISQYGDRVIKIKPINLHMALYPIQIESSTKEIFSCLDNDKKFKSSIEDTHKLYKQLSNEIINFDQPFNDLQPYTLKKYPLIEKEYKSLLEHNKNSKIIINGAGSYLLIIQ